MMETWTLGGPRAGTPAIDLRQGEDVTVRDSEAGTGKLLSMEAVGGRKLLSGNQPGAE